MPQIKNSRDFGQITLSMVEKVQILASQSELVTEVKELLRALAAGSMKLEAVKAADGEAKPTPLAQRKAAKGQARPPAETAQ
jgi:hypothetical protein